MTRGRPERKEAGEIAAGNTLRLVFALDNCSKGETRGER
jgi:hypothetical protein